MSSTTQSSPLFTTKADKSGYCPLRDGNQLHYEIHGKGETHILLIMGLLASKYSWRETLNYFTSKPGNNYTILVFDNRGVGHSSAPWGRYTTSMLAEDALDLLNHVGWTGDRSIHVNGVSMGGMISLQLCLLPEARRRIRSLTLTSTCAKHQSPPRTRAESAMSWVNFFRPKKSDEDKVQIMMDTIISDEEFLDSPAPKELGGDGKQTNRERIFNMILNRIKIQPAPRVSGTVGQIAACLTHNCSHESLSKIAEAVPDVLVITGENDKMIDPRCSDVIYKEMSGKGIPEDTTKSSVKKVVYPKKGHGLAMEAYTEYHKAFEQNIEAGDSRWKQAKI